MATTDDTRAALVLVALALAGAAIRLLGGAGAGPGEIGYRGGADRRPDRDSVAAAAVRLAEPLQRGERIDLDVANASELTRLPRIGPALAARIVRDREARGPFGSLEGLRRISGVGPGVIEAIRSFSTFSASAAAGTLQSPGNTAPKVSLNTATVEDLEQLPGIGRVKATAIVEDRRRNGRYRTVEDLRRVRGIGGATVERLRDLVTVR